MAGIGPEVYAGAAPSLRDNLIDRAASRLARSVAQLEAAAIHVTSEVRIGFAADTIRTVAHERDGELIVMGTHGRTGLAHLLLGSVAEGVVREAPCPVLTVRARAQAVQTATWEESFMDEAVPTE